MAGFDVVGYDVLGDDDVMGNDDVLGAAPAGRGGLARARWAQQLRAGAPGAPAIAEMMLPLGFGSFTFTAGGPTSITLTATPQLAFRGERLIISSTATSLTQGVDANALFTVDDLKVGQRSQLVSASALPASAFSAIAFGVRLAVDPCAPGILISLKISYIGAALTGTDTATVTAVVLGRSAG
jgi:hypothetical protein